MKLPNAERAIIRPEKLYGYLLSRAHPVGRFKAAFFANLGYMSDTWPRLRDDLKEQHLTQEAQFAATTAFGEKYEIRAILKGPKGKPALIVSIWFVPNGGDVPEIHNGIPGRPTVSFKELDLVVLRYDIPNSGLKAGDLGTVVQTYGSTEIEVEFVRASGHTEALLTLRPADVRAVASNDLVSVRPVSGAA